MFRIIATIALCAAVAVAVPIADDTPSIVELQVSNGVASGSCTGAHKICPRTVWRDVPAMRGRPRKLTCACDECKSLKEVRGKRERAFRSGTTIDPSTANTAKIQHDAASRNALHGRVATRTYPTKNTGLAAVSKIDELKADAAKFSEPAAYQTADPALYKSVRERACVRALASGTST
jgi:hypothetical protein